MGVGTIPSEFQRNPRQNTSCTQVRSTQQECEAGVEFARLAKNRHFTRTHATTETLQQIGDGLPDLNRPERHPVRGGLFD